MPEELYGSQELSYDIHGGDVGTLQVLHLRPKYVDMSAAQHFRSSAATILLSPVRPVPYCWIASDVRPHGVVGEAELAKAEGSAAIAGEVVIDMIGLLPII